MILRLVAVEIEAIHHMKMRFHSIAAVVLQLRMNSIQIHRMSTTNSIQIHDGIQNYYSLHDGIQNYYSLHDGIQIYLAHE